MVIEFSTRMFVMSLGLLDKTMGVSVDVSRFGYDLN